MVLCEQRDNVFAKKGHVVQSGSKQTWAGDCVDGDHKGIGKQMVC